MRILSPVLHFIDILLTVLSTLIPFFDIIFCKPRGKYLHHVVMPFILPLIHVDNCVENVEKSINVIKSKKKRFLSPKQGVDNFLILVYIITVNYNLAVRRNKGIVGAIHELPAVQITDM